MSLIHQPGLETGMNGLSVLVVDDEPLARRRLTRLLGRIQWVGEIDEACDVAEARDRIDARRPDVLLLDIQMPGGTGFEIIEYCKTDVPAVIFVTAFDHHALRAFEANAVDYVTKPIDAGRFQSAMERAHNAVLVASHNDRIAELQETITSLKRALNGQEQRAGEFWVRSHGDYLRIAPESIIRFQANRDYVRIHTRDGDYLFQENLASLERRLDPADFVRVHRSTIVRRSAVLRMKTAPYAALIAVLSDGSEVRVGRTYVSTIRARMAGRI